MYKKALSPLPLRMVTGNLLNLVKTSEISPTKDEFLASYIKKTVANFGRKWKTNQHLKSP